MLASLRRLNVVVQALGVCAFTIRRSARSVARKTLALALVEVMIVSSSWSLMAGPGFRSTGRVRALLNDELLSILGKGAAPGRVTLPFIPDSTIRSEERR